MKTLFMFLSNVESISSNLNILYLLDAMYINGRVIAIDINLSSPLDRTEHDFSSPLSMTGITNRLRLEDSSYVISGSPTLYLPIF